MYATMDKGKYESQKTGFEQVSNYAGYNLIDKIYQWTDQALISLPPSHCPTNHFDSMGWFDVYRLRAREKFTFPQSSKNKNVFSMNDPRTKYEHGVAVDKETFRKQYGDMGPSGPYVNPIWLLKNPPPPEPKVPLPLQNPIFPQFKGFMDVKLHFRNGRKVVAAEQIPTGKILAVDPAYAILANPKGLHKMSIDRPKTYSKKEIKEYELRAKRTCHCCSYCLTLISPDEAIPCPGCSEMIYCSSVCQEKANAEFHKFECGAFDGLELNWNKRCHQQIILAYRAICRLGPMDAYELFGGHDLDNAFSTYDRPHNDCNSPRDFIHGCTYGAFDSRYINAVRSMGHAGNFAEIPRSTLCNLTAIDANTVIRILEERTNFFELSPAFQDQDFRSVIGGLAFQILLGLQEKTVDIMSMEKCVNLEKPQPPPPPSVWAKIPVPEVKTKSPLPMEHVKGVGIFPTISTFAHACFPNAFLAFDGRNCYAIASRLIEPEEEITINWFPPAEKKKAEGTFGCMDYESRFLLNRFVGRDRKKKCCCRICSRGQFGDFEKLESAAIGFNCMEGLCKQLAELKLPKEYALASFACNHAQASASSKVKVKEALGQIVKNYEEAKKSYENGNIETMDILPIKSAIDELCTAKSPDSQLTFKLDALLKKVIWVQKAYVKGDC